jgi:hypothetical protein
MESKTGANIAAALSEFVDDVGVPDTLVCDLTPKQTGKHTDVMQLIRRRRIKTRNTEKGRGVTQNHRAETEIREVETKWKARMQSSQVPSHLWDYGLVYIAEIQSLLARGVDQRPGIERITGNTIDISEWLDFDFFERVWYWDQKKMDMTEEQARIGRWLGISHRLGSDMTIGFSLNQVMSSLAPMSSILQYPIWRLEKRKHVYKPLTQTSLNALPMTTLLCICLTMSSISKMKIPLTTPILLVFHRMRNTGTCCRTMNLMSTTPHSKALISTSVPSSV